MVDVNELEHKPHPYAIGGTQARIDFDNGYGASVIKTPFSYGGDKGLWEIAVMHGGSITYTTPVTDDVLGYLTDEEANKVLSDIEALPAAS